MSGEPEKELTPEEAQAKYQEMREQYTSAVQKAAEMEGEKTEHVRVLEALEPLEDTRKCFRLIGGVLVERTAKEVRPAIKEALGRLEEICSKMNEDTTERQKALGDFAQLHNLRVQGQQGAQKPGKEAAQQSAQGEKKGGVLA
eukprot:TRINITY_DN4773_c0_g1_i1.p1 TRINITY_DN4773_c0_g1~~TRINITY_DN4773_c0_g1_i1.p1  ORF type:complete len:143 (+),score=58.73 TRINITY_DN4773_c0_g1_i1:70-498(+)